MKDLYLILYNVRSRFNVGAIFRTADAAGVKKIYLCGITPTPPHHKIAKVALGAEDFVKWEYKKQTVTLIKKLRKQGVKIIALEQSKKSVDFNKFKPKFPLVLIVGNEVSGLPDKILKPANQTIEIPMKGKKESLNVAVATGIILFAISK
jgi:tRNA G18 (ribose-2'-O)-methylase SpoU